MEEKRGEIHVNLISQREMKAHTKEMRSEMDSKFVKCLMATGLTKADALNRVRVWNGQWKSDTNGK